MTPSDPEVGPNAADPQVPPDPTAPSGPQLPPGPGPIDPPPIPPSAPGIGVAPPHDPTGPTLGPRRLHPASPVLDILPFAQQGIVPLVVLVVSIGRWGVLGALVLAALAIGWRVLAWSRHSYRIEDGVLRIDEGVLRRDTREVPLSRIQQVDLRRQLRHRVLGVVAVRIDTAGGGSGAEVVLDAMSDVHALELRTALLDRRPTGSNGAASTLRSDDAPAFHDVHDRRGHLEPRGHGPVDLTDLTGTPGAAAPRYGQGTQPGDGRPLVPEVVAELSTRDLAIAGLTGSGLLAGLSIVGFAFLVLDYLPSNASEQITDDAAALASTAAVVGVLLLLVIPLWLAVAAGSSILRDHEFTLVRYGTDLHVRRGLLDQREATLAIHRIQAVWVNDNPLRRRLGLSSVQLQSAGSGSEASGDVSRMTIPLVRAPDLARLLGLVLPGHGTVPPLVPAPPAARRRARVRAGAPVVLLVVVLAVVVRSPVALLALVAFVPAMVLAERTYRALGHARTADSVVSRWGAVVRRTVVVPVAKTQSCLVRSSPFQRRAGLATLTIQVAGSGPTVAVIDGDAGRLDGLRNGVLVAPGARLDEVAVRRRTQAGLEAAELDLPSGPSGSQTADAVDRPSAEGVQL